MILNGVDTEAHAPRTRDEATREEVGLPPEVPVVGSVGRLEPVKGYDVMITAFAELLDSWSDGPPPMLVIAGDGSEMPRLERAAAEMGIQDRVRFLGWRDDIQELLSCFCLFTMSSHSEGTSVSLLEAMSSGLFPVVTRVGGNPEVLGPRLEHGLVPPEAPGALAAAWRTALANRDELRRDGRIARERVVQEYSLDRMVRAYEETYAH